MKNIMLILLISLNGILLKIIDQMNYIKTIPQNAIPFIENIKEEKVLLTINEIKNYNKEIMKKTDSLYDLENITYLRKQDILKLINKYQIPDLPKYNNDKKVTSNEIKNILENRNIGNIEDNDSIQKGIIIKRSNLRSFPTDIHFFYQRNDGFDSLQETELTVNTPILIIHESKDKNWNFVISPTYAGWVKKENIALATKEDWKYFINNTSFVVIIEPSVKIENTILDMGVTLPYLGTKDDNYQVVIPIKGKNGFVTSKMIQISKKQTHINYLLYTKQNVIIQSFKYEAVTYSWGGMNENVDCSSFVLNIYKTFGFQLPRNTTSQQNSIGSITSLENKTGIEKLNILSNHFPSIIYKPGHVMIYLGMINGNHYIIHASGDEGKVVVTDLLKTNDYLSDLNQLVTIP